jgi:alcohol dehydrogenase (cytochrome c)
VVLVTVAATFYLKSLDGTDSLPMAKMSQAIAWRTQLFVHKAEGDIPDFSWGELLQMTRRPGGFGLEDVVRRGVGLEGSLQNAYNAEVDHQAGAHIFEQRCAVCHGKEGTGTGHGPPLNRSRLNHGSSDLAIYKVLREGIPGTAMVSADLSLSERWQVVGYVKTLVVHRGDQDADDTPRRHIHVSDERLHSAGSRTDEWLTYSGALDGRRYTPLKEITPVNVSRLRLRWVAQLDGSASPIEATPLVVDGVMFTTVPPATVVALDAKSGEVIWEYKGSLPAGLALCCGPVNRGLAILGRRLFFGRVDGYLVALRADTGEVLWQSQVADPSEGYTMTGAPLIVNGSVVVGVAGGEFGIRGFLAAYDAVTGQQRWRFHTIPGPGEPGHETWGDGWQNGGGPTWITGSYDSELDLLYWGVGNPGPNFNGDVRPGDNLFTNSVIALQGSSGKLVWYFQFTPHDEHDWDSTQTPILADVSIQGVRRKVICWLNRNGFYYVLDRTTGEFLVGVPFVEQNWAKGLDPKGRPILADESVVSSVGQVVRPGVEGGTNWQNPAFDQGKGLIFVHATEGSSVFTKSAEVSRGAQGYYLGSAGSWAQPPTSVVRALDVTTGAKQWEHILPSPKNDNFFYYSGLLATGGGLVWGASGGSAFALDSATGQELWRVLLDGDTRAAPISFTVDGKQVVALSAGRMLFLFGL